MHDALADAIVDEVRGRIAQGDYPTARPQSAENLEDCVAHLANRCDSITRAMQALDGEISRLRGALEIIAGRRQCADNLLGNQDVARIALDTPRSL